MHQPHQASRQWPPPQVVRQVVGALTAAVLAVTYDYVVVHLTYAAVPKGVLTPGALLGDLGLCLTLGLLLAGLWALAPRLADVPRLAPAPQRFLRLFAPHLAVLALLFVVYRTDHRPHPMALAFYAAVAAPLVALAALRTVGARRRGTPGEEDMPVPRWMGGVALTGLLALAHGDRLLVRYAGLHIADFHRMLTFLALCVAQWLATPRPATRLARPRAAHLLLATVLALAATGTATAVASRSVRASVLLDLRVGETAGLLLSPAGLGRSRRLPMDDPPAWEPLLTADAGADGLHRITGVANAWIVLVDALRADGLPCHGPGALPPAYRDRFLCFSRAISPANSTNEAMPAIIAGTRARVGEEIPFVTQGLVPAGKKIGGAVRLPWFEKLLGVDVCGDLGPEKQPGWRQVHARSTERRRRLSPGSFFVSHYWDVHLPPFWPLEPFSTGRGWAVGVQQRGVEELSQAFAALFSFFDTEGIWEDTAVVITADHGEDLFEKGYYSHSYTLSEAVLRVPLLLAVPGVPGGVRPEPVTTLDIAPTLAALLGIGGLQFEGRPLYPVMSPPTGRERWLFTESNQSGKFAVYRGRHKYVWDRERLTHELYDVVEDPAELSNLVDAEPLKAAELLPGLAAFVQAIGTSRRRHQP